MTYGDIPDEVEFREPIGKLVFSFGYLEKNIDTALGRLIQIQHYKADILGGQIKSLRTKITLLDEFCRLMTNDDSLQKEMTDLVKRLWEENSFRNSVLHGQWTSYLPDEKVWSKARINPNNFRLEFFRVSVKDILEHELAIQKLDDQLDDLVDRITEGHPPTDKENAWPYRPAPHKPKGS